MKKLSIFIVGVIVYLFFFATVLYEICFVGNIFISKGIDSEASLSTANALSVDLVLIALFGFQHSIMARSGFKKLWTRLVPEALERSIYVLTSSLALILLFWQWRPIPGVIWSFDGGFLKLLLTFLFWLGWGGVFLCSFLINHFDLFGLRQVYLHLRGVDYVPIPFKQPLLYKYMRHPMMLAFLIAFWATPQMSYGHLLFSIGMTAFILIGILFEERDLIKNYGETYEQYRRQVSMLIPMFRKH